MGSLFTKIFLAFWLTAVLLGASFYLGARSLGDRELEQGQSRLAAHAETAANLYAEQGLHGLRHWLRSIHKAPQAPIFVIDEEGHLPFEQPIPPRLALRLQRIEIEEGTYTLMRGRHLLLIRIKHSDPHLYLGTTLELGRLHSLPGWARIAIALIISALISLGLATLLSRPIRRLRHAAQAMAAGKLDVRIKPRGRDEVAELGRDFDIMAERLSEMLQSQRRLLSDVSHELRSPLARLRVALELFERSEDQPRTIARIEKEADELEKLVGNLLSLARLESGQAELERRSVSLLQLLQPVINDAEFEASAKGRHVVLESGDDSTLEGDPVLLRAAIENVVRNAIRFTAEGTTITVRLECRPGQALIEVCDHGDGVPEAELSRIFDAFTRIDASRERGSGGYGLGLSITGKVIAAHGGTVAAHNRPEGGLCVILTLPAGTTTV